MTKKLKIEKELKVHLKEMRGILGGKGNNLVGHHKDMSDCGGN